VLFPVDVSLYLTLISVFLLHIFLLVLTFFFPFQFGYFLSFFIFYNMSSHIVDDRSSAFLEEVRKAMEASRQEAGVPAPTVAPSLADVAAAVRESGLAGALNNIAARTISHGVRFPEIYKSFSGFYRYCVVIFNL
jgi:hypothetical protein